MKLTINGKERNLPELDTDPALTRLIALLEMKPDQIAVERNGDIVRRSNWERVMVGDGDKLEIVQFVGGGFDGAADGRN